MVNANNVKLGQEVFFVSRIGVEKCSITSQGEQNAEGCIEVHHRGTVDYNGNKIISTYGESYVKVEDLFLTLEEAVEFVKKAEADKFAELKGTIKNLKDLLEFPVKHSFTDCDGCGDYLVIRAYKERAFELTGIEIDE